jgi:hypothetical protein
MKFTIKLPEKAFSHVPYNTQLLLTNVFVDDDKKIYFERKIYEKNK